MADINTLKGFIKTSSGDIILPISRGELIFDASGNIALHSSVFKAEAASRYTLEEINNAGPEDDAYGKTVKSIKTGSGKYGLMTPEDLLDLHEALSRISIIESLTGITETGGSGESLKLMLLDLISKVGYYKGEVTGKDDEGNDIIVASDSGIYEYINNKIVNHLALSDALKFKGTLGTGGNTETLPTENIGNGDTYKVITSGSYVIGKDSENNDITVSTKIGDLLIALYTPGESGNTGTYSWTLVPSGNEQETFLKVQLVVDGETIDRVLSGTIGIVGSNGVSVIYNETLKKLVVSGAGTYTEIELQGIKDRLEALETTVNGKAASGTIGDDDYVAPVLGLTSKTALIQLKINDAVTTWDEVVAKEVGEDGISTKLVNGDDLVKASAVYDVTVKLATHIATAEGKYLLAETIELTTSLSEAQKAYLTGTITN